MVDEALSVQSEAHPNRSTLPLTLQDAVNWKELAFHRQHIALCRRVFSLDAITVVMVVVSAKVVLAEPIDLLQNLLN